MRNSVIIGCSCFASHNWWWGRDAECGLLPVRAGRTYSTLASKLERWTLLVLFDALLRLMQPKMLNSNIMIRVAITEATRRCAYGCALVRVVMRGATMQVCHAQSDR